MASMAFLILMPAIGMRLWAEERKSGTIELLMTLPVTNSQLVLGKFLASWFFTLLAIIMTIPIWITVNYLGEPDNGVIFISYLGSWLMAGCFLSLTSCLSMLTKNQVIAFIVSTISCFIMVMAGFGLVLASVRSWAPLWFTEVIQSFSFYLILKNSIWCSRLNDFYLFYFYDYDLYIYQYLFSSIKKAD